MLDKNLFYDSLGRFRSGAAFEAAIAADVGGWRVAGPGQDDVLTSDGEAIECKFFTRSYRKGVPYYGLSNGIHADHSRPVLEQIREYCQGFDRLAVGRGDIENDDYTVEWFTAAEAYEWLAARICAKGAEDIRFTYDADSTKRGGAASRLKTLAKNGWTL